METLTDDIKQEFKWAMMYAEDLSSVVTVKNTSIKTYPQEERKESLQEQNGTCLCT